MHCRLPFQRLFNWVFSYTADPVSKSEEQRGERGFLILRDSLSSCFDLQEFEPQESQNPVEFCVVFLSWVVEWALSIQIVNSLGEELWRSWSGVHCGESCSGCLRALQRCVSEVQCGDDTCSWYCYLRFFFFGYMQARWSIFSIPLVMTRSISDLREEVRSYGRQWEAGTNFRFRGITLHFSGVWDWGFNWENSSQLRRLYQPSSSVTDA